MEFFFGVELEGMWLGKKEHNLPSINEQTTDFAEAIVPHYNRIRGKDLLCADFAHGSHPGHYPSPDGKDKWIVALDGAIGNKKFYSQKLPGHPLEFVSPKLTFGPGSKWREEIREHWDTLLEIGDVEIDNLCATHVHISPKGQEAWSLEQLKNIAMAIIFFAKPLETITAPSRRVHHFAHNNKFDHGTFEKLGFAECCEHIQKPIDKRQFVRMMHQLNNGTCTRNLAWNFINTDVNVWWHGEHPIVPDDKPIGTIEWRAGPGVNNTGHCLIWVEFAVSFVQAAAQFDTRRLDEIWKPDVAGLKQFMRTQAGVPTMNDENRLDIVFHASEYKLKVEDDKDMTKIFDERLNRLA